jgi:hypothetical protein
MDTARYFEAPMASRRGVGWNHAVSHKPPSRKVLACRFLGWFCQPSLVYGLIVVSPWHPNCALRRRALSMNDILRCLMTPPTASSLTISFMHTIMARLDSLEHPHQQEPLRRLRTPDVLPPFRHSILEQDLLLLLHHPLSCQQFT